jgi:ribonuclease HII
MQSEELERLIAMSQYEKPYWDAGKLVAGIDEAGRGPLAGPCVAAAVVMPRDCLIAGVDDSKKLTEKKREVLYDEITDKALCYAVGIADNTVIDEINILNAAKRAFAQAISELSIQPDYVFSDRIGGIEIDCPYQEITGGDALCYSIAAASIVAKVTRDRMMRDYEHKFPGYGFSKHKGYATKQHRESILELGVCEIHRMSFLKKLIG